jgi:hypothetical protein
LRASSVGGSGSNTKPVAGPHPIRLQLQAVMMFLPTEANGMIDWSYSQCAQPSQQPEWTSERRIIGQTDFDNGSSVASACIKGHRFGTLCLQNRKIHLAAVRV